MPESPTLLNQLSARTKTFLSANNLTQKELCRLLKLDRSNFSKFLAGQVGIGAETTLALVRLMNLNKRALELRFAAAEKTRAAIVNLQERGKVMRLDGSGWVSGISGDDPVNSTSITDTWKEGGEPSGDDIVDVLRLIDAIHADARKAIADYVAKAQRAHPNANGPTEIPRKVNSNADSSKPSPRASTLNTKPNPRHLLAYLKEEQARIEADLAIEEQIAEERVRRDRAQMQLAELKDGKRLEPLKPLERTTLALGRI